MSLLNDLDIGGISDLTEFIRNPFKKDVKSPFRGADFPEGFLIEELKGAKAEVRLVGNMMPMIPFTFGGEQRTKKDYYAGHSEPTVQVLGPQESDVTIKGVLKDRIYDNEAYYGVSTEIQQAIDAIRIRGNLCRFVLGEWERYGYIQKTNFKMNKLSYVEYEVTFLISGFNAPRNARFLQKQKLIPFEINQALIAAATQLNQDYSQIPDSVPQGIGDLINGFVSDIATEINKVTNLVDSVINTVGDIQKSIARINGLIKNIQNKVNSYKRFLSGVDPFDTNTAVQGGLTGRYETASFYARAIAGLGGLAALMNRYREQFNAIASNTPLGRHIVRTGDNLQKISSKFYGTADNWQEIKDYNNLTSTELVIGAILEIPRV
jgi:LysM repeat protein